MKTILAALAAAVLFCAPAQAANDTIKAVRTTIAEHDAAEAKAEAAQDARIKALEASVAALQPAQVTPPIATAPAPLPPSNYPAGVVAAGLQAVFDARPGNVRPFVNKLPSTWTTVMPGALAAKPLTQADTDAAGTELYFNGGAYTLDNWRLGKVGGIYSFAVGHVNGIGGAAQVALSNSLVDQINADPQKGAIVVAAGSTFTASKVSFLHASGTNLNLLGDSSLTDVYFDSPGQNPTADAHTEGPHYFQGNHTITRGFFDARGPGSITTAQVYGEAANGNLNLTIRDSIFLGAQARKLSAPIQAAGRNGFRATLRLENVVIEAGTSTGAGSRYIITSGPVTVTCVNCRDALTGANIDGLVNVVTP